MGEKHINDERIEYYILKKVMKKEVNSDDDFSDVEQHLAECDTCAERAHELLRQLSLVFNYDVHIDNAALIKQQMKKQLKKAIDKTGDQTMKSRLQKWMNTFQTQSSQAFKVLLNMPQKGRKLTRLMLETIEKQLISQGLDLDYDAQPLPGRHCEDDRLIRVNRASGHYGDLKTDISIIRAEKRLIVEFEDSDMQKPPLLMLIPTNSKDETQLGQAEWNQQKNKWEIVMNDLNNGTYYTFFEPFRGD